MAYTLGQVQEFWSVWTKEICRNLLVSLDFRKAQGQAGVAGYGKYEGTVGCP